MKEGREMLINNLALPMRAQPFHLGHELFLARMSQVCVRGLVFLCREQHPETDPFSAEVRKRWVEDFLQTNQIFNMAIAIRSNETVSRVVSRFDEYTGCFGTRDFVVVTTNETDEMYRRVGFRTFNHHIPEFVRDFWGEQSEPIRLFSTGEIVRERLRKGLDCSRYLRKQVEQEARELIQGKAT